MTTQPLSAATLKLIEAVEQYLSEVENPVPDYVHRRILRDRMRLLMTECKKAAS
jgi:hypothetical protein